ncbi:MAG: DUF2283 domain-containing protein [bacterium]|nr:DUF2283 domain-containing protein [bacterium]
MKIKYDKEVDALYIALVEGKVAKTSKDKGGILFDVDKNGVILGIEILDYIERTHNKENLEIIAGRNRIPIPA